MSEVRRIISTSFISLLLVIWGLFMVCSGRVPTVAYDDEFADSGNGYYESDNSELMTQLAVLDEEATKLEDFQRQEILEALGIDVVRTVERFGLELRFPVRDYLYRIGLLMVG